MSIELENLNFCNLLHAMIRQDDSLREPDRSRAVMLWALDKAPALGRIMTLEQRRLTTIALQYFRTNKSAPSYTIFKQRVESTDKADGMLLLLQEYEGHASTLPEYMPLDLDAIYEKMADAWKRYQFSAILSHASTIAAMGVQGDPKTKKPDLNGPDDARMYLLKELQSPLFANEMGNIGGTIAATADRLVTNYERNKRAAQDNSLVVSTGISQLDDTIFGMARGSLNLILGYAGQRKSALARTFAYNAACAGFRVLFIPLEISFERELTTFGIIHAHNPNYFENRIKELSVDRYMQGQLTPIEERALAEKIVPDLKKNIGDRLIIQQVADSTWDNIRTVIEIENFLHPLDVVVIDYIGLFDTRQYKDKTLAINEAAIQMKQMALTFQNGKGGLIFVTPAQGSRKGLEDAKSNEGVWEKTGIFMYSELEKSADIVFYTYLPPELQSVSMIKIGTCKSRNSADAPCQLVPLHLQTGYIGKDWSDKPKDASTTDEPQAMKDPTLEDVWSNETRS